ncbi:MAG: BatD family protein [Candidatus Omnitrophica bacterium]|jgi:hypothetical protein|nr:BatD family protein [Candidatus Omnitrophota bacterium]
MLKKFIIFAVLFLLSSAPALAQTSIKAEIDKQSISTDEALTYKIIIVSTEKQIPRPQLPAFEGFNVVSQAQSTSVNFSSAGVKNAAVFIYILVPNKTGEIEIKPSSIKVDNQVLSSDSFKIQVKQGKSKPQPKLNPKQQPSLPQGISSGQEETTL